MSDEVTDKQKTIPELFFEMINIAIDDEGVYPHQMVHQVKDETGVTISALAVDAKQAVRHAWDIINGGATELVVGLDMWTKPEQGTEFKDVVALAHFTRTKGKKTTNPECWRIGVINYQSKPRIVREIDWENSFWDGNLRHIFTQQRPIITIHEDGAI